ncbi:hypothetical protein RMATCC62417_15709 [Rhizopus microsporus]|nr:hypothetical protein RMATCC62417_15709 [Rhizopus microsporus]
MSRAITDIIQQWRTIIKPARGPRPTADQLKEIIKTRPNSLEAKIATSPAARIMASPLRQCALQRRIFPSKLLLRFGLGWHPETKRVWAYPTIQGKTHGAGYYVSLQRRLLDVLKGGIVYNSVFRGNAMYRADMTDRVQDGLCQASLKEFLKIPTSSIHILQPVDESSWVSDKPAPMGYQCIIILQQNHTDFCAHDHSVYIQSEDKTQKEIPCYYIKDLWSDKQISQISQRLNITPEQQRVSALGVPKSFETVDLAVELWRCREFIVN